MCFRRRSICDGLALRVERVRRCELERTLLHLDHGGELLGDGARTPGRRVGVGLRRHLRRRGGRWLGRGWGLWLGWGWWRGLLGGGGGWGGGCCCCCCACCPRLRSQGCSRGWLSGCRRGGWVSGVWGGGVSCCGCCGGCAGGGGCDGPSPPGGVGWFPPRPPPPLGPPPLLPPFRRVPTIGSGSRLGVAVRLRYTKDEGAGGRDTTISLTGGSRSSVWFGHRPPVSIAPSRECSQVVGRSPTWVQALLSEVLVKLVVCSRLSYWPIA